jgi:hypothetical protein
MHLNHRGILRYYDYLNKLNTHDVVVFSLPDVYKAQHYVKRDAIDAYFPEFVDREDPYHYAGILMMKNTPATRQLITEWLSLCENYHFLDGTESIAENIPGFQGSDYDNGLLNLCLAKHSAILYPIPPYETNLYDSGGHQYHGPTTETDWDGLRKFPFQVRRLRPPR